MSDIRQILFMVQSDAWHFLLQIVFWGIIFTLLRFVWLWISVVAHDFHKAGKERVRKLEAREAWFKTGEF